MRITEREERGMNPLITPKPLQQISQQLLTADDKNTTLKSVDELTDGLGRGIANAEIVRSRGGSVREDTEMLEDMLNLIQHCSEDIDTIKKQINQEVFTEETAENLHRVMKSLESVIDQLGNRVYKKLDSLQGY
jgi:uncharacterized protein Yka (UPF0111/DUF47 family)